ncbi:hypothetical protein MHK_004859 [Candidatus Magnetomorum sp. HK-1]|nr:hypothetical protein MHK_004859 [Candidatus Magnetomorum sp. HK-1]
MYLAYDGDKVGRTLESLLIDNNELKIEEYANTVFEALNSLKSALIDIGCRIIFASGDSILATTNKYFDSELIKRKYGNITFSLGIGNTPLEAMLALKKAKSKGFAECLFYSLEEITT